MYDKNHINGRFEYMMSAWHEEFIITLTAIALSYEIKIKHCTLLFHMICHQYFAKGFWNWSIFSFKENGKTNFKKDCLQTTSSLFIKKAGHPPTYHAVLLSCHQVSQTTHSSKRKASYSHCHPQKNSRPNFHTI
jgi:hypothetical protein